MATLPASGDISLGDIESVFGTLRPFLIPNTRLNLGDCYRGGSYIPDIAATAGIPTSGDILISNFYGKGYPFGGSLFSFQSSVRSDNFGLVFGTTLKSCHENDRIIMAMMSEGALWDIPTGFVHESTNSAANTRIVSARRGDLSGLSVAITRGSPSHLCLIGAVVRHGGDPGTPSTGTASNSVTVSVTPPGSGAGVVVTFFCAQGNDVAAPATSASLEGGSVTDGVYVAVGDMSLVAAIREKLSGGSMSSQSVTWDYVSTPISNLYAASFRIPEA